MDIDRVKESLKEKFTKPLHEPQTRHIIFWYDQEAGFEDSIEKLNLDNVKIIKLQDNHFQIKYLLEKDDPDSNYLIYAPFARPDYQENWLLDILLYSQEFSADKASVIMNDFGIEDTLFKSFFQDNLDFFDNKDRYLKLKELSSSAWTEDDFRLGMLAVSCSESTHNFENCLKKLFIAGLEHKDDQYRLAVGKWPGEEFFWKKSMAHFGFQAEEPTLYKLFIAIILAAAKVQIKDKTLDWLFSTCTRETNCLVFADNWMNHSKDSEQFDRLSQILESELEIKEKMQVMDTDDYMEADIFRIFDQGIILDIINGLASHTGNYEKYRQWIAGRRTKHWFPHFEKIYNALEAGINLLQKQVEYAEGFPTVSAKVLFENYGKKYYTADQAYRRYYYYADQVNDKEILKNLTPVVERYYSNNFLEKLSNAWTACVEKQLTDFWPIPGVKHQYELKKMDEINSILYSNDKEKVYVIISDGFRFECAAELEQRLLKSRRGQISIEPMQAVVPSFTQLGMASLLPVKDIQINKKGHVIADGQETQSFENRKSLLDAYEFKSIAFKYNEFMAMKREQGRAAVKPCRIIFIYHDRIDAAGDKQANEHNVFNAAEQAITDMEKTIVHITGNLNGTNIFITADHGFLYRRNPLEECDKVDKPDKDIILKNRRFIVHKGRCISEGAIQINMGYLPGERGPVYVSMPRNVSVFKMPGGGMNYVHGGYSLQEVCIPFLKFRHIRLYGGKNDFVRKVGVELIKTISQITTNNFNLKFFQKEKAEGSLSPSRLKIALFDGSRKISDEKALVADLTTENAEERIHKLTFILKHGNYDKNKDYFLEIRDADMDVVIKKEPFKINLSITNDFDDF
ncbi:MAG: BREX-1 system phosphatase PglZ type A [bacterium]